LALQAVAPTIAIYVWAEARTTARKSAMPRIETVLLATDGLPASAPANEQAIDLAVQMGAKLIVVSVVASLRPKPDAPSDTDTDSRDSMAARAQGIVQRAKAAGAKAAFLVWEGEAGDAIVAAADSEGADLIVIGSHGRSGVSRFFIGSVSDYVVRHAHCPVMVVRGRPEATRR
jgi:nucleotide-binding universal stress UspA family protein